MNNNNNNNNNCGSMPVYYIRSKFSRGDKVKYISHLDMIRMFTRTFRRAQLPVSWSNGFNPHPEMVFALPLAVGVTSECDYLDVGLETDYDPGKFMENINLHLPEGFRILKSVRCRGKSLMSSVEAAIYEISIKEDPKAPDNKNLLDIANKIGLLDELKVEKVTEKDGRKHTAIINIKPMIRALDVVVRNGEIVICAAVDAGSRSNLRPDLLFSAIKNLTGTIKESYSLHRKGLFALKDGILKELWE